MKTTLSLCLLLIVSTAFADFNSYYPQNLTATFKDHSLKNDNLKAALFDLVSAKQVSLGYDGARKVMFGQFYLKNDQSGYYIEDVYCQKRFGEKSGVAPNAIPKADDLNCEHTWPQSRFTKAFPEDMQKSDLHHLYPADSKANSIRGNMDFTEVTTDNGKLATGNCAISKFGSSSIDKSTGFEPPLAHKGNVARSLFYFSVRYKIAIPPNEEEILRRWNDLDPVDQDEINHNDEIEKIQKNRNPFVDFPSLVNDINQF